MSLLALSISFLSLVAAYPTVEGPSVALRREYLSSTVKRVVNGSCATAGREPAGSGPITTPDTDTAFLHNSQYKDIANSAPTPQGYSLAFVNFQSSVEGDGYLGYHTMESFDTTKCQQYCDAAPDCYGINIFIERDPSLTPSETCPDPNSTTNYKCSLWGHEITKDDATNFGQWRDQFHVVISGSNGYFKDGPPPSYANFSGPSELGGSINAPVDSNSYMGSKVYPGPYDPGQCATSCQETTAYDKAHLIRPDGTYDACNFFNAYVLSKNNEPQGTYCAMYTMAWDKSYSTNYGYEDGSDYYSVSQSYAYTLTVQDPGKVDKT